MLQKYRRRAVLGLAAVPLLSIPSSIGAQATPSANRPVLKPIRLRQIAPNAYWSSEGGNVGVVIGPDGVIVFDATGSRARAAELQARIAEVTPKPIRAIILSHSDGDHVDGIGGLPAGIPIIAHRQTQTEMQALAAAGERGIPADHLPNRAITASTTMTLVGEPVRLLHWGPAHTAGDLVAYFPREKIVFAADLFCMDQPRPYIKPELNGSSAGWVRSAQAVLALNPKWVVVGHGEPQTPANLRTFVADSVAARVAVVRLAGQGKSLPEIEAATGEPQPSTVPVPPHQHLAQFTKAVYGEVVARDHR